jgi:hypothetical protein
VLPHHVQHLVLPGGRDYHVDQVRLVPSVSPGKNGIAISADGVRLVLGKSTLLFDLTRGGALVLPDPARVPELRPGDPVAQSSRLIGPRFEYRAMPHEWHSSAEGAHHAQVEVLKTEPDVVVRVVGGAYGPWGGPHVDLQTKCTFDYRILPGPRDPVRLEVTARLHRMGGDLPGLEQVALVWPLGENDMPPAAGSATIEASEFASKTGSVRIVTGSKLEARYQSNADGRWELCMPLPLLETGILKQDKHYEGQFVLEIPASALRTR